MAGDLESGQIVWRGKGVLNPFEADGRLASLADYPRFSAYLHAHRDAVVRRHVAGRNPAGWYRTIDRISPSLRSEEHTSELQSLMRISYAVFCLKKKKLNTCQYK